MPATKKDRTDWKKVDAADDAVLTAAARSDPDSPPLDENFFAAARRVDLRELLPQPKAQITIRVDQEVLDWFKAQGPGYQTRMNAVLKAFKQAREERAR